MSMDTSSKSFAFSVIEVAGGKKVLKAAGKIDYSKQNMDEKFVTLRAVIPMLYEKYSPDFVVIEAPVYIQNFLASKVLCYIVASVKTNFVYVGKNVEEVSPLSWKAGIGYKNVSKAEKEAKRKEVGEKEMKKWAKSERKERTKRIVRDMVDIGGLDDDDVIDSIGIGIWKMKGGKDDS